MGCRTDHDPRYRIFAGLGDQRRRLGGARAGDDRRDRHFGRRHVIRGEIHWDFVDDNPTIKMLALSFLVMIGMALVGEAMEFHIPKGYIYFAMAFSVVVELLNLRVRKLRNSATLRKDTITVDVDPR